MLTDKDREWLEKRVIDNGDNDVYCRYCNNRPSIITGGLCAGICPLFPADYQFSDAAEFEARVAAKLARGEFYRPCHSVDVEKCAYPVEGNCCVCHIKYARFAVEAEMEQEGK